MEELDALEILENFKDVIVDLLNFKKDCKSADIAELAQRNEQFENMLQKLEAEVRTHVRIEHQLKLHIETTQAKQEETQKKYKRAKLKIKELEATHNKHLDLEHKLKRTEAKLAKKCREVDTLKSQLEALKIAENRPDTSSGFLKKRVELKAMEIGKLQQMVCDVSKGRPKSSRKSLGESEFGKSYSHIKKEGSESKHRVPNKKSCKSMRGHFRSHSDNKSAKKIKPN